ncbi:MAG: hypothetical protein U0Z53_27625 [Blastocatellia bacterium]
MKCVECLETADALIAVRGGQVLCQQCAGRFYIACAFCGELTPQDDAARRDDKPCCPACLNAPQESETDAPLSAEELAAAVAEFHRLNAEEKRVKEQLEAVKEKLRRHAATQQRTENGVTMRVGEQAVKCGWSVTITYDSRKLAAVETMLGAERFAELFTGEMKYSAIKENIEEFLKADAPETAAARAAILEAQKITESARLTVVAPKNSAAKSKASKQSPQTESS